MKCFFNIMVAVDFSTCSKVAVLHGFALNRALKSTIGFVHIIDQHDLITSEKVLGDSNPVENREPKLTTFLKKIKEDKLDDLVNFINELNIQQQAFQSEVKSGEVFQELMMAINEFKADLLVMGAYGNHRDSQEKIGSLAQKMLNQCPVPLVTLTADQK